MCLCVGNTGHITEQREIEVEDFLTERDLSGHEKVSQGNFAGFSHLKSNEQSTRRKYIVGSLLGHNDLLGLPCNPTVSFHGVFTTR